MAYKQGFSVKKSQLLGWLLQNFAHFESFFCCRIRYFVIKVKSYASYTVNFHFGVPIGLYISYKKLTEGPDKHIMNFRFFSVRCQERNQRC